MKALTTISMAGMIAFGVTPAAAVERTAYKDELDGRAIVSGPVFKALAEIHARHNHGRMTGADADRIVSLLLADGKLDGDETDFLEELANRNVRAINIRPRGAEQPTVVFGTQSGAARTAFDAGR